MCSKLNPADAATCQFCGARITPLGQAAPSAGSSETPDWLKDLRGPGSDLGADETAPAGEGTEEEVPDWLARIRQRSQVEPSEDENPAAPDWLSDLSGEDKPNTGSETIPAGSESDADWLGSLRAPDSETSDEPTVNTEADMPDWLHGLQGETPSQLSEEPASQPMQPPESISGAGEDDWLKNLESLQPTQAGGFEGAPSEPAAPAAGDWLSGLQESPAAPEGESRPDWFKEPKSAALGQPSSEEDQDWLKNLQSWQPDETAPGEEPAAEVAFTPAEETTDWLSGFATEPEQPVTEPSPTGETPDWLSGLPAEPEEPVAEPASAGETPDWLSGLPAEPEEPAAVPSAAGETPDWLSGLPAEPEEPAAKAAPGGETPDWLSSLPAESEESGAELTSIGETPDWLSGLSAEPEESAAEPAAAGETMDWLSSLPTESEESASEAAPAGEVPDWLSGLPSEEAETTSKAALAGEVPDWLSGLPAEEEPPAAEAAAAAEIPDWLGSQPSGSAGPKETPSTSAFPAEDVAEWLAPQGAETSGTTSPFVGAAGLGLDWENGEQVPAPVIPAFSFDVPPTEQTPESELPFSDQELPDWLSTSGESQPAVPAAVFEGSPEDLTPAELPTWVSAMRPVESAAPLPTPTMDDQRVESLGPLAGVKGVLPSQDAVVDYAKPPIFSVKLQVNDRQKLHSNLLESMLKEENQPHPVAQELTNKSARWFRLVTALILIAALLFPLIFGGASSVPAEIAAPGTPAEQMYTEINSLTGGPVLLIIDYEPGLAAELQIAARGVIQHLMETSTYMAAISSSPTGPMLAENLFSNSYAINDLSVNLGYVAGDTTALQALVSDLRGALRQPLRGNWDTPFLQPIQRLSDFKQVILLTGNDESARAWIEQIQPALGATPLLVISSAQAAPMLQPYVDSGQVKTLLSGLTGGAAYQQLHQSPTPGNGYWSAYFSAYQTGIAVAIALIVLGLLLQIVLAVLNSSKRRKGA